MKLLFSLQVFQQLQQHFVALLLTILAHFVLGFRPILLLQIFSTPYHFSENRLFRKHVLGLRPGYRVWGERFEGEIDQEKVKRKLEREAEGEREGAAGVEQEAVVAGGGAEGGSGGEEAVVPAAGAGKASAGLEVSAWGRERKREEGREFNEGRRWSLKG